MAEFSHPRSATTMPGTKLPEVIPLERTDSERQKTYSGLVNARDAELAGKLDLSDDAPLPTAPKAPELTTGETDPEPNIPPPVKPDLDELKWTPTADDKKEFVRSVLGMKPFTKIVELFNGEVKLFFEDRTFEETENLYAAMSNDAAVNTIATGTDEAYAVWEARYKLASTLRKVAMGRKDVVFAPADKYFDRFNEIKDALGKARGLLSAVLDASACFEAITFKLTNAAQDRSFWKTAGASSPSPRI